MPRKTLPIIDCTCGCGQTGPSRARGWIEPCYRRWWWAGKPADGPPPPAPSSRQARKDDYLFLRSQGVTRDEARARVGIKPATALKYESEGES